MAEKRILPRRKVPRRMYDKLKDLVTEEERQNYDDLLCKLKMVTNRRVTERRSGVDRQDAEE